MTAEIEIRKASRDDSRRITDLINQAFGPAEHFFVDGERITEAEILDHLRDGAFLLAERDGTLEGCVYIEPRGTRAYLGLLSVDPSIQHQGRGSHLVNAGEKYCRKLGCQFMDIKIVNLRTELPDFYRRRGYFESGTSPFPAEVHTKVACYFIDMTKRL